MSDGSLAPTSQAIRSIKFRQNAFRLASAAFAFASLYHVTAMAVPAFGKIAYSANYPTGRHLVFVFVDGTFAWLMQSRPKWLIFPYTLLTLQVLNGHGKTAWLLWRREQRIDWISTLTVIGIILGLFILMLEFRDRAIVKRKSSVSQSC